MNETSSLIHRTVLPPIKIGGWIRPLALIGIPGKKYPTLSFPGPPTLILFLDLSPKGLTLWLLSHELMNGRAIVILFNKGEN